MEELAALDDEFPGVIGKSFLAAGGIPKNKKKKNNKVD